jgi:aspartate racemase
MKTIGLIGGMSWESTTIYYKKINEYTKQMLGDSHSAQLLLYAYDYHELETLLEKNDWSSISKSLIEKATKLQSAGADFIVICANTMHIVADKITQNIQIPLLHIAEAVKKVAVDQHMKRVLLLGTMYTMQSTIYQNIFNENHIEVITPTQRDQALIHRIIYKELIKGKFLDDSRQKVIDIINKHDIDGVILGCTEIPLLIEQQDVQVPILDTLDIHAKTAVLQALGI